MLWILRDRNPGFGRMIGIVVRADSEESARQLALTKTYGEGPIWDRQNLSSCEKLLPDGDEEVILDAIAE